MRDILDDRITTTRQFCQRWLDKATKYDVSAIDEAFDKFFTLFVAYNRLYFHAAQQAGNADAHDNVMAIRLFPRAIGHDLLWDRLISAGGMKDVQTLAALIGPGGSFFVISGGDPDFPDEAKNAGLYHRLISQSPRVAVEAVLEYLYKVRCNMFHGRKAFEARQLDLLQPALRCLERIVSAGLEWIASRDGNPETHSTSEKSPDFRSTEVAERGQGPVALDQTKT